MKKPILVLFFVIFLTSSLNCVSAGEKAYIANRNAGNVSVIDLDSGTIVDTITVGFQPISVAASESGTRVFILNKGDKTISVIDTSTNSVINTIDITYNSLISGTADSEIIPKEIVASPAGDVVYVADEFTTILVVNTTNGQIIEISPFTTNLEPHFGVIDISPTGDFFYAGSVDNIAKFDAATLDLVGIFDIDIPASALVVTDDGSRIYSEFFGALNNLQIVDTANFIIDELDLLTEGVFLGTSVITLPPMTASPDGRFLYIVIESLNSQNYDGVAVIDMENKVLLGTVPVGTNPVGIDITSDGRTLVIPNNGDNTVTIIDTQTLNVLNTVHVGPTPRAYRRFISKESPATINEAELHLASLGVTMQQAKDFIFANVNNPELIFDVALKFNVTTLMLSQITGFSTNVISEFFASFGLDTTKLDT